ncbi:hypothetical protein AAC387_Pa03g3519 [Persea americana]
MYTSSSSLQDSHLFNYLSNLTPLNLHNLPHVTETCTEFNFSSPPQVFASPRVCSQREAGFMKRPPYQSRNSSDAGKCFEHGVQGKIFAAIPGVAQPSINLSAVELIPSTRMGIEPCTTSGIVDKFLVDHSNECGTDALDLCSKKAAIMPQFLHSGWSSPDELLADNDGIGEDEETEADETLTSSEEPEDNQASEKSFPNMEIVETASHKPERKNDGRPSNESQDLVFKNVNCFMDDFLFIKSASRKEDDPHFLDWTANEFTSLLSSSKEHGFVECGKEMPLHSSDLDQHGTEDIKPHFAEGRQQGEEQFTPQILPESFHNDQVDDIHYENNGEISLRKVKNRMPHECKESAQQRGMRRRCLRFDTSEAIRKRVGCSSSWNVADVVSIVRSPSGLTKSEILNASNVPSKTPEDHMDEVERPARNSGGTPVTAAAPSGLGLHLNRMGYDVADSCNLNRQLTAKDYLNVKGKNSLPETNLQISSFVNPSKSSLQINLTEQHAMPFVNKRRPLEDVSNSVFNQMNTRQNKKKEAYSVESEGCNRCHCKKSKCLKLYCQCFAAGEYCIGLCSCKDCYNKPEYEDTVLDAKEQIESREPNAFAPKITQFAAESPRNSGENGDRINTLSARHKKGCTCKKSKCLKKYCECYQTGVGCSILCRCEGCENVFGNQ